MSEFIVANARTLENETCDIEIRDGSIDRIVDAGNGDMSSFEGDEQYDAGGRLVTPTLVEPHTHLDDTLLAGRPYWNRSNTLEEGWRKTSQIRDGMEAEEYKRRAKTLLKWFLSNGITHVRSHVNTGPEGLEAIDALLEVKDEISDTIELQLVAFPSASLYSGTDSEAKIDRLKRALDAGVDIVGGIPHKEDTREKGVKHVRTVVELADKFDKPLDPHIDETDDPQSRFTEILASEALERGIGSRTSASHVTALHSYSNAYADKLIRLLSESGVSVITNPLSNAVLQGRYDDYPRRRGHTRIRQLREADVTVGIGQDDVIDLFHPYGDGDPLKTVFVLVHFAHMNGHDDVSRLWEMLTEANASIFGIDEYGLEENHDGSLVVYDGYSPFDVLRTQAPRRLVLRNGRVVARTEQTTEVEWDNEFEHVTFDRPSTLRENRLS